MSNSKNLDLSTLIPGFDMFKQMAGQIPGVGKNLGQSASNPFMPQPGKWIAPSLSIEELEKRITELQTVKLWLENNARLIEATIQALQVQKMTLSTLQDMKINLGKAWAGLAPTSSANANAQTPSSRKSSSRTRNKTDFDLGAKTAAPARTPSSGSRSKAHSHSNSPSDAAATAAGEQAAAMQLATGQAMQMWQGLTQQFGQIASQVMQDSQAAAEKLARSSATKTPTRKSAANKTRSSSSRSATGAKKANSTATSSRRSSTKK